MRYIMPPKKSSNKLKENFLKDIDVKALLKESIDRKQLYKILLANDTFRSRVITGVCKRIQ